LSLKAKRIPSSTKFGSNLKYLRNIKGLSQSKLANEVGLKRNNIASYESGMVEPKATIFIRIANYFSIGPYIMLEFDLVNENILSHSDKDKIFSASEKMALEQIEELSFKTHEMTKIVEGYQTFKEIHESFFDHRIEISHMMLDTLKLFENLLETNWNLIHAIISEQDETNSSEAEQSLH
jgi:transcriptional regulator with XRE-family HTH domain